MRVLPTVMAPAFALALTIVTAFGFGTANAEVITAYTASGPVNLDGDLIGPVNPVTSITTAAGGTVTGFVGPTETNVTTGPDARFGGNTTSGTNNDTAPDANDALVGNNLVTALGNANGLVVDVLFGTTITDNDAASDNVFELFVLELGGNDDLYTLQPIISGTAASPTLGGNTVVLGSSVASGPTGELENNSGNVSDFAYGGEAVDLSDMGVSSLIGVRFSSSISSAAQADPAVILAVPEPASLALMGLGGLLMLSRRRKA